MYKRDKYYQLKINIMKEYTPIAMRCTQEQFDAIKPKLKGFLIEYISPFSDYNYLVNNLWGKEKLISNANDYAKEYLDREVHEEWNEEIFLEACGVNTETSTLDPVFIERYNITDKVKELLKECKEQGFELNIDNGVIILKQI